MTSKLRNRKPADHYRAWLLISMVAAVMALIYLATELKINQRPGFPLDDPWIHLTFARNLAQGQGFAYNPGEPVQGSTAPLWTLLLACFHCFTGNPVIMVWIAKVLGIILLIITAGFGYRLTAHLTHSNGAGIVCGIGLTAYSHLNWAMVSGMEVTLVTALVLGGSYYAITAPRGRKSWLSPVLFALAVYARPESLLIAGFLLLEAVIRRGRQFADGWLKGMVYLLLLVPYFVLNWCYSGSLFPQTYLAKVGATSLPGAIAAGDQTQITRLLFQMPWVYLGGFVAHLWTGNPVLTMLTGIGLGVMIYEFVRSRGKARLLLPLLVIGYAPLQGMIAPFVRPAFQSGRYLGSPVAASVVVAVFGAWFILQRIRRGRPGGLVLLGLLAGFNLITTARSTARNTALAESSINRQQVAVAEWLAANVPRNSLIACNDVGAIGYLSRCRVLDLLGLVTRDVLPYRRRQEQERTGQAYLDYLRERKPDYLAIFPDWFPFVEKALTVKPVFVADVPDNIASAYDLTPELKTIAGILITDLPIKPVRAVMKVYQCFWDGLPGNETDN